MFREGRKRQPEVGEVAIHSRKRSKTPVRRLKENLEKLGEKIDNDCGKAAAGIDRTPGALPSGVVYECDLHYENHSVDDIYKKWESIIPDAERPSIEKFVTILANLPHSVFQDEETLRIQFKKAQKICKIVPRKAKLLHMYRLLISNGRNDLENEALEHYLVTKSSRSLSGVLVIAVLTSPYPSVGGKTQRFSCEWNCYYCPNQPGQPRSYLRDEPAVVRANQNGFDPVCQFTDRAATLAQNGHPVDKVELLVLGGTWSSYPQEYQECFVRDLYFAANTFFQRTKREKLTLSEEQHINETARCKIIGLTLETRPDTIVPSEVKRLRDFGVTRLQIGVQHTDDNVLERINRKCTTARTIEAIRMLKDACFKIDIHLMPNLPGSTVEKDDAMFSRVLEDPDLQADQWKIYPCEVTPWTIIRNWFEEGTFKPYSDEELFELIMRVKAKVHPWIRLNRVIRDIPTQYILGGVDAPSLRETLQAKMAERGMKCKCIRCREVGADAARLRPTATLRERQYWASEAREVFLSFETPDDSHLFGFLRLRLPLLKPKHELVFPELEGTALVRELHVYGQLVEAGTHASIPKVVDPNDLQSSAMNVDSVFARSKSHAQHVGFGTRLVKRAEDIARDNGYTRVAIIAGVGTRSYYEKLGYTLRGEGHFMMKDIPKPTQWTLMFLSVAIITISTLIVTGLVLSHPLTTSIIALVKELMDSVLAQFA